MEHVPNNVIPFPNNPRSYEEGAALEQATLDINLRALDVLGAVPAEARDEKWMAAWLCVSADIMGLLD